MIRQIQFLLLILLFTACTTEHYVMINNDGSARVEADRRFDSSFVKQLYASPLISDINDSSGFRLQFTINTSDSIGNYLSWHCKGYLQFKDYGDSIVVKTGDTIAYSSAQEYKSHLYLRIATEDSLQAYKPNGKKIKYKKRKHAHGWVFSQSIGEQKKSRKNIHLILK